MLKIKKYINHIVHVGEGSEEERESEIVLEMARRCKPRMHFCDTFTFNHPEKGKHMLKLLVN